MDVIVRVLADGLMIAVAAMAAYSFLILVPKNKWWYWGVRIFLAGLTTYLAAKLIGHFYQPETLRPFEKLGLEPGAAYLKNPGFPSDHALFATFLTIAVWVSTKRRQIAITMLVLTAAMALGRVLALVHTPLDVIGGMLIPLVGVVWYGQTANKLLQYIELRGVKHGKRRSGVSNK